MSDAVHAIQAEILAFVRQSGGDTSPWSVGLADDAAAALFQMHEVDPVQDVWLWKPAASAEVAARLIGWMTDSLKAVRVQGDDDGHCVFMFKKL